MKTNILNLLLLVCLSALSQSTLAFTVLPGGEVTTGEETVDHLILVGTGDWKNEAPCREIYKKVQAVLGKSRSTDCMMKLFSKETTCAFYKPQKKGNAGNPEAGFGVCTIESRADLRQPRGPHCRAATHKDHKSQILCCRDMMKNTPTYYGAIRRGEMNKCY